MNTQIVIQQIVLGFVQGVTEWLPISSSGIIALIQRNAFHSELTLEEISRGTLFLHLGTFFAALVYFREDVINLFSDLFRYSSANLTSKKTLHFLMISTLISGVLGLFLLKSISSIEFSFKNAGQTINFLIGICLIITGILQLKSYKDGGRQLSDIKPSDSILLGVVQGFTALPGFSRSGLTVAALLMRRFDETQALRLSFLMSLPIVFFGNIIMEASSFTVSLELLIGLFFSFIFGLLTIHLLLNVAKRVNFGYFVILFGLVSILSSFI